MDRRSFIIAGAGLVGRLALPAGIVAVAGCSGSARPPGAPGFEGATMGTRYSVRLGVPLEAEQLAALETAVRETLSGVDGRMSTYAPASELSRLNASRDSDWQPLSADTARVLAHARGASEATGGAFDVTVGPLVDLWGFGPSGSVDRAPAARDVAVMLERVGWRHLEVDAVGARVRKTRGEASADLSGVAKGYGVDAVADLLAARGIGDFLVEVGGELATRGTRPDGERWRVAVEQPTAGQRRVQRVVDLRGRAIATSGDYRNWFADGGQRYSHSIDPRSGRPVSHGLASVSVVADTAMEADAASTALMVMGPDAGPAWAREHGVAALFLARDGGGLRETSTPALAAHLRG